MPFDDDDVRWLLSLLQEEGLEEIEVEQGDVRIRVCARQVAQPATTAPVVAHVAAVQPSAAAPPAPVGVPLPAPMAGIFYRQPSPDAEPFVEPGDRVEAGDVVGLIEVMKLFNEIIAPVTGVVVEVVVESEERVEAEQPLMYIQPASKSEG